MRSFGIILQRAVFSFFYLYFRWACRGVAVGEENLKKCLPEGFILVANHASYYDAMVLWSYLYWKRKIKIIFLVKAWLFYHPFFSVFVRAMDSIRVSNTKDRVECGREYRFMKGRKYICIFPEGGRSRDGNLQGYKNGAGKIARIMNLPILPVALVGFFKAWPRGTMWPNPTKCEIRFLAPIYPAASAERMVSAAMSSIGKQLRPEQGLSTGQTGD
ncbi:MAG: lysophospholipid acyltransferase family protein [Smithella sp.]|nr:lysophospholipid acyltransferase family protein [Smithella sp.]